MNFRTSCLLRPAKVSYRNFAVFPFLRLAFRVETLSSPAFFPEGRAGRGAVMKMQAMQVAMIRPVSAAIKIDKSFSLDAPLGRFPFIPGSDSCWKFSHGRGRFHADIYEIFQIILVCLPVFHLSFPLKYSSLLILVRHFRLKKTAVVRFCCFLPHERFPDQVVSRSIQALVFRSVSAIFLAR